MPQQNHRMLCTINVLHWHNGHFSTAQMRIPSLSLDDELSLSHSLAHRARAVRRGKNEDGEEREEIPMIHN
jgi:hypothetical protein